MTEKVEKKTAQEVDVKSTVSESEAIPSVKWDDSKMTSTFANVVNATFTREEVTLFFGTNQTWNPSGARELAVELNNRIIITPFAAKRLVTLLNAVVSEYEKRFGKLDLPT